MPVASETGGGPALGMVFDAAASRCLCIAPDGAGTLWNGVYWISDRRTSAPSNAIFAGLAYDSARQVTVRFGGGSPVQAQTWERAAVYTPSLTTMFGAGCGSPAVLLAADAMAPPAIGKTTRATVTNAFLGIAFVAWGYSNTTWGSHALPVALDPFGFEGCMLLQSGDIALDGPCAPVSWNTAAHAVPVPPTYVLVGASFYLQAWTLQPGFNTNGIVLSNGLALTIGDI